MEIEQRMGFKVRSKYEDIVAWIQSDPPGVPYPKKRKSLQLMDSHVYAQLNASLSTEATMTVADDFYRRGGGPRALSLAHFKKPCSQARQMGQGHRAF